jgi:glycosyltransferase involved in cell wall biosynthesis
VRLLIVTQYFWPENFRINDLVAELTTRGHDIVVLTGYPNYPDGRVFAQFRANPREFAAFGAARVVRVPLFPRGQGGWRLLLNYVSFAFTASTLGVWRLRGRRFDAILAYEPSPITIGIPAAVLRRVKRAPLAFWVLDLWPETLQAIGVVKSKYLLKAVDKLVAFVYRRCDLILAQSRSFVPQIARHLDNAERIAYFPGWAEAVLAVGDVAPSPVVPLAPGSFNVMFAGNVGDAQDFPAILAAAEALRTRRDIRWLIVGDGRAAAWVAAEVERRELRDTVLMLGRHPLEDMPSFYKHADALLVSLKDEPVFALTVPGKLQSYLAAGIPVLAMLNGESADVVRRSRGGLTCAAGDSRGLATAVLKLQAMTSAERAELGRNAKAFSAIEFDRATLISRLESWLSKLKSGTTQQRATALR